MQRTDVLQWPYIEGLRLDEAQNPLTLLAVGIYGEVLPAQNGAPIRLVVPWKYGFKGVKSIVRIRFVENQPRNTWQTMAPSEYGFYANVNPTVDHPRWSQAREKRLPSFIPNRKTEMFNGYTEQVAYCTRTWTCAKTSEADHGRQDSVLRRGAHPRRGARLRSLRDARPGRLERAHCQPGRLPHRSDRHLDDRLPHDLRSRSHRSGASPAGTSSSSSGACSGCSRSSTPRCTC